MLTYILQSTHKHKLNTHTHNVMSWNPQNETRYVMTWSAFPLKEKGGIIALPHPLVLLPLSFNLKFYSVKHCTLIEQCWTNILYHWCTPPPLIFTLGGKTAWNILPDTNGYILDCTHTHMYIHTHSTYNLFCTAGVIKSSVSFSVIWISLARRS